MNTKTITVLATGVSVVSFLMIACSRNSPPIESSMPTPVPTTIKSSVDWTSKAVTVDEQMLESDLVVRASVSAAAVTRALRHELPVWDQNNKIVGSTISETLFSNTVFEVIKTYWGEPQLNITVAQTGGVDPAGSHSVSEIPDEPLYHVGEEYVLFLVDISGDPVQAPDRELYRIVNPFGRYRIEGENVFSYGQVQNSGEPMTASDIIELETQIQRAAQELK